MCWGTMPRQPPAAPDRAGDHSGEVDPQAVTEDASLLGHPPRQRSLGWTMAASETPAEERLRKYHGEVPGEVGFIATACLMVNMVLGAGFLGIPRAFYDAGLLLSVGCTIVACLACDFTKNLVMETMARAEAITEFRLATAAELGAKQRAARAAASATGSSVTPDAPSGASVPLAIEATTTVVRPPRSMSDAPGQPPSDLGKLQLDSVVTGPAQPTTPSRWKPQYRVTARKFEVVELCDLFLGRGAKLAYLACLCLFLGGAEWAFASVFSASFSANVPVWFLNGGEACDPSTHGNDCSGNVNVYLGLFALIVLPLSCMGLSEQKVLQMIMFVARIVVILLMVATTIGAMLCDGVAFADIHGGTLEFRGLDISGLRTLVPVVVYGFVVQPGIPTISQPSQCRKRRLSDAFSFGYATMAVCYVLSGVVLALYFGKALPSQANLPWDGYVGCVAGEQGQVLASDAGWAAKIVRWVVVMFPAIDVASWYVWVCGWRNPIVQLTNSLTASYPLQAICLAGNALSAWAGDQAPKAERMRWLTMGFRLLAAVPPLVGAIFVTNLDKIMSVAGVIGFGVAFFVPVALAKRSEQACVRAFGPGLSGKGPAATDYRSRFHFPGIEWVVTVVFAIVAVYALVNGIIEAAS